MAITSFEGLSQIMSTTSSLIKSQRLQKSLCALTNYFGNTQGDIDLNHMEEFRFISTDSHLKVSPQTLRGLEIIPREASQENPLFSDYVIKPKTSMGKRHLKKYFFTH